MNTTSPAKRFFNWAIFIIIIGLIIWGLIAAQNKAAREDQSILLPGDVSATDHVKNIAPDATTSPVTLVEYGDFQCPACGAYHPIVEQVLAAEGSSTVRFVFRHFPLTQHQNAIPAAEASEAASNQGKFWEMYDLLYNNQADWQDSTTTQTIFDGYATQLGLDVAKFDADSTSQAVQDVINNDYKGGVKAGINGTPTFFLNGTKITNPSGYDDFKKLIDDAASTTSK